jgi:hypothetical protein
MELQNTPGEHDTTKLQNTPREHDIMELQKTAGDAHIHYFGKY